MADRVYDDLGFGDFVEDEVRIWRCRQTTDDWIISTNADVRMSQKNGNNILYTSLNAFCASGRITSDVIENRIEVG